MKIGDKVFRFYGMDTEFETISVEIFYINFEWENKWSIDNIYGDQITISKKTLKDGDVNFYPYISKDKTDRKLKRMSKAKKILSKLNRNNFNEKTALKIIKHFRGKG